MNIKKIKIPLTFSDGIIYKTISKVVFSSQCIGGETILFRSKCFNTLPSNQMKAYHNNNILVSLDRFTIPIYLFYLSFSLFYLWTQVIL